MSTTELRRRAKEAIDQLSGPRLRFLTNLLAYIQQRQPADATTELLQIPGFLESFVRGNEDLRAGRITDWRKVRRDV